MLTATIKKSSMCAKSCKRWHGSIIKKDSSIDPRPAAKWLRGGDLLRINSLRFPFLSTSGSDSPSFSFPELSFKSAGDRYLFDLSKAVCYSVRPAVDAARKDSIPAVFFLKGQAVRK